MEKKVPLHRGARGTGEAFEIEREKQSLSREEAVLSLLSRALLGRSPNGEAECDLVDKVGEVVDQVQGTVVNVTAQVTEEVPEGVNGPTHRDDEAHRRKGRPHMHIPLITCCSHFAGLAEEDLVQDEEPTCHAHIETHLPM